jgi:hypothetical protein
MAWLKSSELDEGDVMRWLAKSDDPFDREFEELLVEELFADVM